jgi:hypothetical protein
MVLTELFASPPEFKQAPQLSIVVHGDVQIDTRREQTGMTGC